MVHYLFSDKTGTLTQNIMEFKKFSASSKTYTNAPNTQNTQNNQNTQDISAFQQAQQGSVQQFPMNNKPFRFPLKVKKNMEPIDYKNEGWFFIENVKYNLVLEIKGGINENGMNIVMNRNLGNRNQLWRF